MKINYLYFTVLVLLGTVVVSAQATDCPIEINTAFATANSVCVGVGRNQVCYGNEDVNVTAYQETTLEFESPGDIAALNNIRTLSLSALDFDNGYWGIAVMRMLANLDPSQAEDVTMLLYGDVEIEDASGNLTTQTLTANTFANMRRYPNTTATVMDSVAPDTEIVLTGRLEDNSWVRVTNPDTNIIGWILASLLTDIDFESLDIVASNEPYFAPMQAFYFRSGTESSGCASVPRDGILVQTPEGLRRVTLWVNEVTIDFMSEAGSTATIQTTDTGDTAINVLEGTVFVSSESDGYVAVAGSTVTVSNSGSGTTSVSRPVATSNNDVDNTTLALLDRDVQIPPPADTTTIDEANGVVASDPTAVSDEATTNTNADGTTNAGSSGESTSGSSSSNDTTTSPSTDTNSGKPDCPGNSCNAPGQSGNNGNGNGNGNNGNNGNGNGNGNNGNNGNGNGNGKKK